MLGNEKLSPKVPTVGAQSTWLTLLNHLKTFQTGHARPALTIKSV
jgi:hypothetical protein